MSEINTLKKAIKYLFGKDAFLKDKNGRKCIFYKNYQLYLTEETYQELLTYIKELK